MLYVAKFHLGKVKLKWVGQRSSLTPIRDLWGSPQEIAGLLLCVLLLALGYIVALLADHSRPVFAFLRIIVDSCWLPSSLLSAYILFLLTSCLYVTQITALQPVFPGELPTLTMGANPKVPLSSAIDVRSSLHPASVPEVPSSGFFGLHGRPL